MSSKKRSDSDSVSEVSEPEAGYAIGVVPIKGDNFNGTIPTIWISTRRADDICYELLEMRNGVINVVAKDALPIIRARAEHYLQRLGDGLDV